MKFKQIVKEEGDTFLAISEDGELYLLAYDHGSIREDLVYTATRIAVEALNERR